MRKVVGPIFFTSSPQKLTRLSAAPLSTVSVNEPIGFDQLAPVVSTYEIHSSVKALFRAARRR